MSMPLGFKSEHGYATVRSNEGGFGYREIAETMTDRGFKMNHSTARNIFLSAMYKIASDVCKLYDQESDDTNIKRISSDPRFQSGILDVLKMM
jgi:hypothetical protein